jgi:hypothetical protein
MCVGNYLVEQVFAIVHVLIIIVCMEIEETTCTNNIRNEFATSSHMSASDSKNNFS